MDSSKSDELEQFREQWRAEVRAKKPRVPAGKQKETIPGPSAPSSAQRHTGPASSAPSTSSTKPIVPDSDDDYIQARSFDDIEEVTSSASLQATPSAEKGKAPATALEYYEQAVEKEAQGSLGDSLRLYRTAFRVRTRFA
jgi:F-box protein 9